MFFISCIWSFCNCGIFFWMMLLFKWPGLGIFHPLAISCLQNLTKEKENNGMIWSWRGFKVTDFTARPHLYSACWKLPSLPVWDQCPFGWTSETDFSSSFSQLTAGINKISSFLFCVARIKNIGYNAYRLLPENQNWIKRRYHAGNYLPKNYFSPHET